MSNRFLPICREDLSDRGLDSVDFILVTGDAYVDHPSFGTAIIGRVLEAKGYSVGIIAQPDWNNEKDFLFFGTPNIGVLINGGNLDSMVANYTVAKRQRDYDYYSPGGKTGLRPDRAVIVYSNICRRLFGKKPIIIGGLEASLRRFAHYDYWQDSLRQSILVDSCADILVYGMGENQTIQLAAALKNGEPYEDINGICYLADSVPKNSFVIASYSSVCADKVKYAVSVKEELENNDHISGKRLAQKQLDKFLIQNPPMPPLETEQLDWVYSLPFCRDYHPSYKAQGGIPAIEEVKFSINHNRGCYGACNFCALAFHQGRSITTRSEQSVLTEARLLTKLPDFKGYIHDVGGPTANFRAPSCKQQLEHGVCKNRKCLAPTPCKNLIVNHEEYLEMLRKIRKIDGIKSVFIRSGIRYDYLIEDPNEDFFRELVKYHVSGQLKVAPEHCSANVLDAMGKPHIKNYLRFKERYYELCREEHKEQYLVPYFMSSHPGSTLKDAVELALFLKREGLRPKQVQDFYPTPGTISTAMYYSEVNPYTLKPIYVPKTSEDKALQRALLQYFLPKNKQKVIDALKKAGRTDLIGPTPNCLVYAPTSSKKSAKPNKNTNPRRKVSHKWNPTKKR